MAETAADREWKRISIATSAAQALELTDDLIVQVNNLIDREAYTAIVNGSFTPDQALLAFGRKQGIDMIRGRLTQQQHAGQRAARAVQQRSIEDILDAARK
jgi:hypothetical protein